MQVNDLRQAVRSLAPEPGLEYPFDGDPRTQILSELRKQLAEPETRQTN